MSSAKNIGIVVLLLAVLWGVGGSGGKVETAVTLGEQLRSPAKYASTRPNPNRPVLAFYYMWYAPSDWCLCHMSDLPTSHYNSSDDATIDRQVTEAANAGITGFVSSWWGQGDKTDRNFARLLVHSASLEQATGRHFA